MKKLLPVLFLVCLSLNTQAQDSTSFFQRAPVKSKNRVFFVAGAEGLVYSTAMLGLNELWYKNYPRSNFHLFNDFPEWQQMDKVGHFTTAYYVGKLAGDVWKWAGIPDRQAIIYGALTGLFLESSIEVMDGFSSQWGFSIPDMAANTLGSTLVLTEGLIWNEQRIQPKFSFHTTSFSQYRPNVLGSDFHESILKDYNGQTYWLSANIASFHKEQKHLKWLNIAFGYGAEGMTGGNENVSIVNGRPIPQFKRERQFYISLDADLSKIKTRSSLLQTVFKTIGFIKIPAPALEIRNSGVTYFHWLYF